jgi:hypothetical protein
MVLEKGREEHTRDIVIALEAVRQAVEREVRKHFG